MKKAAPLRVVLDTNVLLSALLFSKAKMSTLHHAWQDGRLLPLVSRATTEEFITALSYPKFKLTAHDQEQVLAAYLPFCEVLALPASKIRLPPCRDPDDQKFLLLAAAAKAEVLVTGDKDLLTLPDHMPFAILTPAEMVSREFPGTVGSGNFR